HRLVHPVGPELAGEIRLDDVPLRLSQVAIEARQVVRAGEAEREAEMVDLITERRRLELIDHVVALVLPDGLERTVERVAERCDLLRSELALAGRRARLDLLAHFDERRRIVAAAHLEPLAIARAALHRAVLEHAER